MMAIEPELKPRVLVVDDEPFNIKVLAAALESEYTTTFAKTGREALEIAATDPKPDIILLDVLLPDMDGFEVCARLKVNEATVDIPVIFVTMVDDHINEEKGLALGAVDYIPKPIRAPVVQARVRLHVRLNQHRRFLEWLVNRRTEELEAAKSEALELLRQLREDATVPRNVSG